VYKTLQLPIVYPALERVISHRIPIVWVNFALNILKLLIHPLPIKASILYTLSKSIWNETKTMVEV